MWITYFSDRVLFLAFCPRWVYCCGSEWGPSSTRSRHRRPTRWPQPATGPLCQCPPLPPWLPPSPPPPLLRLPHCRLLLLLSLLLLLMLFFPSFLPCFLSFPFFLHFYSSSATSSFGCCCCCWCRLGCCCFCYCVVTYCSAVVVVTAVGVANYFQNIQSFEAICCKYLTWFLYDQVRSSTTPRNLASVTTFKGFLSNMIEGSTYCLRWLQNCIQTVFLVESWNPFLKLQSCTLFAQSRICSVHVGGTLLLYIRQNRLQTIQFWTFWDWFYNMIKTKKNRR